MSNIALVSPATGTATFSITTPSGTSTDRTLTLPDNSGTVLTSATTTGFPAGSVLQVVNATYAVQTDFSGAYADTGLTATITPSSATSKILVLANQVSLWRTAGSVYGELRLVRDSTALIRFEGQFNDAQGGSGSTAYLDSPNTTSAVVYKTQCFASGPTIQLQRNSGVSTITLLEIAG